MKDMMKDRTIEREFKGYFDGAAEPNVDLTEAKAELQRQARRRERVRRGLRWQIPALAAVLLLVFILGYNFLPALFIKHYSIAQTTTETISYTELKENYDGTLDGYLSGLDWFALAKNASVEYTVYSIDGKKVLLGANVRYLSAFTILRASVLVDLTNGKYVADEFAEYEGLEKKNRRYQYNKEYVNGEYVYRAYSERDDARYYVDFTSQDSSAFQDFMDKLFS